MKYIGYHGTSHSAGSEILARQEFRDTTALDAWLGKGVYFFLMSEMRNGGAYLGRMRIGLISR